MIALMLGKWNDLTFINFICRRSSNEKVQPNAKHVFQPKRVFQF
jgi:hypothetical protein